MLFSIWPIYLSHSSNETHLKCFSFYKVKKVITSITHFFFPSHFFIQPNKWNGLLLDPAMVGALKHQVDFFFIFFYPFSILSFSLPINVVDPYRSNSLFIRVVASLQSTTYDTFPCCSSILPFVFTIFMDCVTCLFTWNWFNNYFAGGDCWGP